MKKFTTEFLKDVANAMEGGSIPFLVGEPGIGKSSWVMGLEDMWRTKVFILSCNELACREDLTGARLVPNPNKTDDYMQVFYPHVIITKAIEYAESHKRETPVLFLDEINRAPADAVSALLGLATTRVIGTKDLPANLRIIVAGNDKGNVVSLDSASVSRFIKFSMVPDANTFINVMGDNINPFVKNVLSAHPETVFCKHVNISAASAEDDSGDTVDLAIEDIIDDADEMRQFTTPRTLDSLCKWLNCYTNNELIAKLSVMVTTEDGENISDLEDTIRGFVGQTMFTTYLMQEIAQNAMSTTSTQSGPQVVKPAVYDDMKKCADMDALNALINDMSDNDKSGCLLYSLYEKEDNTAYIRALAASISKLEKSDMTLLMKLVVDDALDTENVQTLVNTGTDIATTLSVVFNM